ncbi:MAG: hypothetical protein ACU833_13070 [Gammaproteobacteria bacterium]
MNEPETAYEKKILLDVVEQMNDPDATERKQAILRKTLTGLGSVGLLSAFFMAINELAHPFVCAFLSAMAGVAVGFELFLEFARKQWPITRRHIDLDSVRNRLEELES